jgi:hypothetical protein
VTEVFTLINSAFGVCGTTVGSVTFNGAANTFTYSLIEANNIRDHFNGSFCNTVTNVAGTASFGGGADRLDMQAIVLPAGFATDTLENIVFTGTGNDPSGQPFLAALTAISTPVSGVPEPASGLIFITAMLGLAAARRRR